jgi:hypothetical protein
MAYDLGDLTAYVNEQGLPLLAKSLFEAKTTSLVAKQLGVKGTNALNLMNQTTTFVYGNGCGFDASTNETNFSQRNITAFHVKVHEALCPSELENYWMQSQLPAGSMYTSIPFEQQYVEEKLKSIKKALETAVWQGTGGSGAITGFAKIANDASVIDLNASTYGWATDLSFASLIGTPANAIKLLNTFETYMPADIIGHDDVVIFCGWDVFRAVKQGLVAENYFNPAYLTGAESGEIMLPASNIKLIAVHGLNGTYDLYAGRLSNFVFGTDLANEEENFEIYYDPSDRNVKFVCEFKAGTQIAFPDQCRRFMMAAS